MGHKLWLISDLITKKSEKFDFFEKMLPYFYVSVKNELKTKFRHFCLRIFEKLQKEIPNLKIYQKFELFGYSRNKVWDLPIWKPSGLSGWLWSFGLDWSVDFDHKIARSYSRILLIVQNTHLINDAWDSKLIWLVQIRIHKISKSSNVKSHSQCLIS